MRRNISIIICSRCPDISKDLRENITNTTAGSDFEIIVIDNSRNEFDIFTAYNEGIRRSSGEILCFMHEDVRIHTDGWVSQVISIFSKMPDLGCLGIIGDLALPERPSYVGWQIPVYDYIQGTARRVSNGNYFMRGGLCEVVAVDGFWFCIPKCVLEHCAFDDAFFNGFHFYDMDISTQILSSGYKLAVTNTICISHSNDIDKSYNASFFETLPNVVRKWRHLLPIATCNTIGQIRHLASLKDDDYTTAFRFSKYRKVKQILYEYFVFTRKLRILFREYKAKLAQ